ncbi:DNA (cytosine-5-)-methyltransferase [Pseudoalteromonas sp. MMG024]|uniref:DNA cytosine methyltransferase n=1 Tax=Pseudoalteromonas sp. MMG024 TaxID=2909980 RepID=UPI001F1C8C71|nr:DNA (cytosine-5-)-methyltransferase [Pseudoalteromonas sp. MMG024]MCF6458732.1 DNA cytosine methyltransferase [Pseudoalteromonas sp. MMG024]
MTKRIVAVDLFCGVGGLTHGLLQSQIDVVAGFDIEEKCKYPYERNNTGAKFYLKDVAELSGEELKKLYPKGAIKLLAGCAPCQPFSKYSHGRDVKNDKKWPLLYEFSRLIREVEPELVTMENVPDVIKHEVYSDFVLELKNQGYSVWAKKVYCPDYGLPQVRKRHVLLASKIGDISLLAPTHESESYVSVQEAIGNLPRLNAGEQCQTDPLHRCASLSKVNLKRIRYSKPGGSWRDWPVELRAKCHQKESGNTYSGVYARMRWDQPSPTMTTQCFGYGNGRFGHPEQDRAISLREAAIFQSFPDNYQFLKDGEQLKLVDLGKMIGNAVPVKLGKVIGDSLSAHLKSH